ncbi:MAG: hypothetical protein QOE93_374 [Actinomycetota bacterium]|nr:hypothetical protein [Actinomycetota bacterium]
MGSVRFGIPQDLAADLVQACGLTAAVETGTYKGESAVVLRTLCPNVWSIELSPTLHAEAAARHAGVPGLHFVQGDSGEVLPGLLEELDGPALFWLDGHVMPGDSNFDHAECPVVAEINAINASKHGADACILIDDAVLFLAAPQFGLTPTDWPSILDVVDLLRVHPDRHVTVLDDVVIAGPPAIREVVDHWWARLVAERGGTTTLVPLRLLTQAFNPTPTQALRRLGKALVNTARRRTHPG